MSKIACLNTYRANRNGEISSKKQKLVPTQQAHEESRLEWLTEGFAVELDKQKIKVLGIGFEYDFFDRGWAE